TETEFGQVNHDGRRGGVGGLCGEAVRDVCVQGDLVEGRGAGAGGVYAQPVDERPGPGAQRLARDPVPVDDALPGQGRVDRGGPTVDQHGVRTIRAFGE